MVEPIVTFDYAVDASDRILEVSSSWLGFARDNGACELTPESVLGKPLWRFVTGVETISLYLRIFEKVRGQDTPILLPFRCDSPDRFRFMRLSISHRTDGILDLQGILIREQRRPRLPILDRFFPQSTSEIPSCSLCRRLLVYGLEWLEPEDAVVRLGLFDSPAMPRLKYTVCDDCASHVEKASAASFEAQGAH